MPLEAKKRAAKKRAAKERVAKERAVKKPNAHTSLRQRLAIITPQISRKGRNLALLFLAIVALLNMAQLLLAYYQENYQLSGMWLSVMTGVMSGLLALLLAWFVIELMGLYRYKASLVRAGVYLERQLSHNLSLNTPSQVQLICRAIPKSPLTIQLMDTPTDNVAVHDLPALLSLNGEQIPNSMAITYTITPMARGKLGFDGVDMALVGRFGLLSLYHHIEETAIEGQHTARILANFRQSLSGNLFAAAQRSVMDGLVYRRRRGQGQDFHQIRAYNENDSIRHINWRASSRLARLMTKEYQDNQDQELLFLIDSSMYMRYWRLGDETQNSPPHLYSKQSAHSISHLDEVLNAMLLLTSVATAQGDAAGFISFSGVNDKVVPAKKGAGVVSHLLNQSYDIQPSLKMSDYMAAAKMAMSLQKKRSLIILMTTTRSEEVGELLQAVNLLRAKHLVLVANLYESDFQTLINTPPATPNDAFRYHAVYEYLTMQHKLKLQLDSLAHVYSIHCTPKQLAQSLLGYYVSIKSKLS